jgi:hypothetical protein
MAHKLKQDQDRPSRIEVVSDASGVNEDIAGVHPPYFWVVDSSTPLFDTQVTPEPSDALWLAKRIDAYLHGRIAREEAKIPLPQLVEGLAAAVAKDLRKIGAPRGQEGLSAAIGIIRVDGRKLEYLILGDVSLALASGRRIDVFRDERVTQLDRAAVAVLQAELSSGASYAQARRQTVERLREHRKYMNVESGYWILSNSVAAVRRAEHGTVRIPEETRLLLASDGFSRVIDIFHLYRGWRGLFAAVRREPLSTPLSKLRSAEAADPESRHFPRLAPHDDATALYLELP